jgi:CheY-like chemotaxis protein
MKVVLLVDDDNNNRLLIKSVLIKINENLNIVEFDNGLEAFKYCGTEKNNCDLILMDIHMPKMNGYLATNNIRKINFRKNTPIIAITGDTSKTVYELCKIAGMNSVLTKPILKLDLIEIYRQYLEN